MLDRAGSCTFVLMKHEEAEGGPITVDELLISGEDWPISGDQTTLSRMDAVHDSRAARRA